MFGQQQASTGKTVYGNGSFAPNRGQVSAQGAQGYLKRSLNNKRPQFQTPGINPGGFNGNEGRRVGAMRIGNDGQSDTRGGVAQAAMQRAQSMMHPGQTPGTKPTPPIFNHEGPKPPVPPGSNGGGQQVPQVKIGDNGQIELPYDSGYSQQVYGDLADFNNQLMGLQQGQQQQALQYQQGLRDENQGFQHQQIQDLGSNAGAGTAFSSRYATDVGNTFGSHQNAVNGLDSANNLYNQQVTAQRANIQDNFNQELQAAAAARAANADSKAGTLGYGDGKGNGGAGGHRSDNPHNGNGGGKGGKGNGGKGNNHSGGGKQTPGTKPGEGSGSGHQIHIHINDHPRPPKRGK
jgi:hypothetical protein